MRRKIYFCNEETVVSGVAITTPKGAFALSEIAVVRTERLRPAWLGPLGVVFERYALVLTDHAGRERCALRHRNAYFVFQLMHAVEAAIQDEVSRSRLAEESELAS